MTPNLQRNRPLIHAFDRLWHVVGAPMTFAALAALLAGTLALAAIIPQQPAGQTADAAESWLAATTASFREAGAFLKAIGAFTILSGAWLRVLLAALGFHLALRLADHLRDARGALRASQIGPPPHGLPVAESRMPGPLTDALAQVTARLRTRYPFIQVENDTARAQIYAERRRVGAWAPVLAVAGALLILVSLFVDGAWGWRGPDLALAPGASAKQDDRLRAHVRVEQIGGTEAAPQTRVALVSERGRQEKWMASTWPARFGNLWIAQQTTGLALAITATDTDGNPLLLQELVAAGAVSETLHVLFQQTEGEQAIAIPARNLALRAVAYPALPDQGITQPVILVEVFRGTEPAPVAGDFVETEATLTVADTTITLRRESYVVLATSYLPGLLLLLAGAVMLLGGIVWRGGWGSERAWVNLAADRDMVGVAARVAALTDARGRAERLLAACAGREGFNAG